MGIDEGHRQIENKKIERRLLFAVVVSIHQFIIMHCE